MSSALRIKAADVAATATEHQETAALVQWAHIVGAKRWPELRWLVHVPNEGKRSYAAAARLKAEGMQAGFPDLHLPAMRGGYGALYIEMKRKKGGKLSEEQAAWIAALTAGGYRAVVCYGQDEARAEIERYMEAGQ